MNNMKPTTAKEVLTILREFFSIQQFANTFEQRDAEIARQREQRKLWDILSALRGPDSDNDTEKYATTSVIRRAIFGDRTEVRSFAIFEHDSAMHVETRIRLGEQQHKAWSHFTAHAQQAFTALGLTWNVMNKDAEGDTDGTLNF